MVGTNYVKKGAETPNKSGQALEIFKNPESSLVTPMLGDLKSSKDNMQEWRCLFLGISLKLLFLLALQLLANTAYCQVKKKNNIYLTTQIKNALANSFCQSEDDKVDFEEIKKSIDREANCKATQSDTGEGKVRLMKYAIIRELPNKKSSIKAFFVCGNYFNDNKKIEFNKVTKDWLGINNHYSNEYICYFDGYVKQDYCKIFYPNKYGENNKLEYDSGYVKNCFIEFFPLIINKGEVESQLDENATLEEINFEAANYSKEIVNKFFKYKKYSSIFFNPFMFDIVLQEALSNCLSCQPINLFSRDVISFWRQNYPSTFRLMCYNFLKGVIKIRENDNYGAIVDLKFCLNIYEKNDKVYNNYTHDIMPSTAGSVHFSHISDIYEALGIAYFNIKDYKKSIYYLKLSLKKGKFHSYGTPHCYIGKALFMLGNKMEACQEFSIANDRNESDANDLILEFCQ